MTDRHIQRSRAGNASSTSIYWFGCLPLLRLGVTGIMPPTRHGSRSRLHSMAALYDGHFGLERSNRAIDDMARYLENGVTFNQWAVGLNPAAPTISFKGLGDSAPFQRSTETVIETVSSMRVETAPISPSYDDCCKSRLGARLGLRLGWNSGQAGFKSCPRKQMTSSARLFESVRPRLIH
jgi:hypothetical protein